MPFALALAAVVPLRSPFMILQTVARLRSKVGGAGQLVALATAVTVVVLATI